MTLSLLITDDSPVSRKIIISCLPGSGYEIREAGNGQEALDFYKQKAADLVFLDLTMPVMDGFEALEHLMKLDPNAKVIVLSSDIQQESLEKVKKLGALDFIPKPPSTEKLKNIFQKHF